ncbi:unnamed protein product, partial [Mesorhabditis belari]|uniref:Replication stress response regulator SDE2 n=1 Tax=Mesorhabditis belari TaxID=2138241 RepID=A0AAF3EM94_9BILA
MDIFNQRTSFCCGETRILETLKALENDDFYLTRHGKTITFEELYQLDRDDVFEVHFRLFGGKGGFGSLLRSFRVNKSTNKDMMRNLDGRRLGAVEKEKKIRKWLEKQQEREKITKEKEKNRLQKLKSKPTHNFEDSEKFEEQRKELEEKTEVAFEDGFKQFLQAKEKKPTTQLEESSSDSESDPDLPGTSGFNFHKLGSKRKQTLNGKHQNGVPEKKEKLIESHQEENVKDNGNLEDLAPKEKSAPEKVDVKTDDKPTIPVIKQEETRKEQPVKSPKDKAKPKPAVEETPKEFPAVDLKNYENAQLLEDLGLNHLKHALETRGLKCGGNLHERATRLFSIKGLKPEQYPKTIIATQQKKTKK